jgi:hypothetical protein
MLQKQAVKEFLIAKNQWKTSKNTSVVFMEVLWSEKRHSSWDTREQGSKIRKANLSDLPHSGRPVTVISPEICSMVMPSFTRIDTLQPGNWRSVFQSAKEVLVTSSVILGI